MRKKLKWNSKLAGAFGVLVLGCPAMADPVPEPEPEPCASEEYRAFDFWLGMWRVHSVDGIFQGENTITAEEDGCLLVERWISEVGGTGQSYNFYDTGTGKWRQLWVNRHASIDYSGGLNSDGSMSLFGEIAYRDGRTAPFTGTWTPNEDGSVTQSFQEYNSETGQWDDWFTGIYTRPDYSDLQ